MTRTEHLACCKERALFELDTGGPDAIRNALASMVSDLRKHPETEEHPALILTGMMMLSGLLTSPEEVRKHIEGFN